MEYNKYKCVLVKESSCEYNFLGNNAQEIYNASKDLHITDLAEEVFYIFCLDTKNNIIGIHEISHGTLSATLVHPREVFKRAILNNANCIVLVHNHPSGNFYPSQEDYNLTVELKECGDLLEIPVIDHVIRCFINYKISIDIMSFLYYYINIR